MPFKALLLILQRYYFESESQLIMSYPIALFRCCLSYKDTILKANHSNYLLFLYPFPAVAYPTKILFWKRITAKSDVLSFGLRCCLSYKDTILKANHSVIVRYVSRGAAVAYPTKILFWKRITAIADVHNTRLGLLLILQRYYFESESQPMLLYVRWAFRCCLSYKDTILKANHSRVSCV